jgi:hypothetical protein
MPDSTCTLSDKDYLAAFRMPLGQSIKGRKTTVTNAFVNALIPAIYPSADEIRTAIHILGLNARDLRCSYCGDKASEWDHLRPLVVNRRPTGYISEIANLVPACGKCNQSKGNSNWREWMVSEARHSPTGRRLAEVSERLARLEAFEKLRAPIRIDFGEIIGLDEWERYWTLCENVIEEMRLCQDVADSLRQKIIQSLTP